jgi:NTP pyrophosphatase (non-canonical NTP hydrolase)
MEHIYAYIGKLRDGNATHLKSGWKMQEISDQKVVEHIAAEVVELAMAICSHQFRFLKFNGHDEKIVEEIADVLNTVLHMAMRCDIGYQRLMDKMMQKLESRFEIKDAV